jgi:hypothetical protein
MDGISCYHQFRFAVSLARLTADLTGVWDTTSLDLDFYSTACRVSESLLISYSPRQVPSVSALCCGWATKPQLPRPVR